MHSDRGEYSGRFWYSRTRIFNRGVHYRWPGWINRMNSYGLTRSMSRKGCSPDNSACEGVFGRIKNEMFYKTDWSDVSISDFVDILNNYLQWYNETRIIRIFESYRVQT